MQALNAPPGACALIGDSTTDVTAARAAGTAVIGYANKSGKREQFETLRTEAIVDSMHTITAALANSLPNPSL